MPRSTITESDLRQLLSTVDPVDHAGPGDLLPATTLRALADLVDCEFVSYQLMNSAGRTVAGQGSDSADGACVDTTADSPELFDLFWAGFWASPACCYPQRTGDHSTVTRLSDFYSRRALGRSAIGPYLTEVGVRHEMLIPLPPDGPVDQRLLFFRTDGPDFTERDVLLMTLLRPHLMAAHLRQRRRRQGLADLTPRQVQIVTMVAAGLTNSQVGRALAISEATVRKHLENVFQRLEVTSRAAAVAKVVPLLDGHTAA